LFYFDRYKIRCHKTGAQNTLISGRPGGGLKGGGAAPHFVHCSATATSTETAAEAATATATATAANLLWH